MKMKDNEIHRLPQLILASASPRRAEIVKKMGIRAKISPSSIPEIQKQGESPENFARRMALEKAQIKTYELNCETPYYILGADTIVVLNGEVYGKPPNPEIAELQLQQLSGKTHQVITGYALINDQKEVMVNDICVSWVTFKKLSESQIKKYVATGEPLDKAGSYGIQGKGRQLIEKFEGSMSNIMGLPAEVLEPWFEKLTILNKHAKSLP